MSRSSYTLPSLMSFIALLALVLAGLRQEFPVVFLCATALLATVVLFKLIRNPAIIVVAAALFASCATVIVSLLGVFVIWPRSLDHCITVAFQCFVVAAPVSLAGLAVPYAIRRLQKRSGGIV